MSPRKNINNGGAGVRRLVKLHQVSLNNTINTIIVIMLYQVSFNNTINTIVIVVIV